MKKRRRIEKTAESVIETEEDRSRLSFNFFLFHAFESHHGEWLGGVYLELKEKEHNGVQFNSSLEGNNFSVNSWKDVDNCQLTSLMTFALIRLGKEKEGWDSKPPSISE
jgi:hypothetical protein